MKSSLLLFVLLILSTSLKAEPTKPVLVDIPIENVYIPFGFDSNDNVEVVVEGWLPNLCYKASGTQIVREGNNINIQVKAYYEDPQSLACAEIVVPYIETVKLGLLDQGEYQITINNESFANTFKLKVQKATKSVIDDHIYANVITLRKIGKDYIMLEGENPSPCIILDSIEVVDNGKDTYSILPKMRKLGEDCPMVMVPFNYEVKLPQNLEKKKVLVHVRALNGKSINRLIYRK